MNQGAIIAENRDHWPTYRGKHVLTGPEASDYMGFPTYGAFRKWVSRRNKNAEKEFGHKSCGRKYYTVAECLSAMNEGRAIGGHVSDTFLESHTQSQPVTPRRALTEFQ